MAAARFAATLASKISTSTNLDHPAPAMFVRLTKAMRLRAGWFLALVYLLCVLAPAASFAFADGSRLALCLTDEGHELGIIHVHVHGHEYGAGVSQHIHRDGDAHEHSGSHAHLSKSVVVDSAASVASEMPAPANHQHKAGDTQCCGMVCVSALPATVTEIVKPSAPASVCDAQIIFDVAGNVPPRHYRPPIS